MDQLIKDVERVIKYSQGYPFDIHVDKLIEAWQKAKEPYLKMFGGPIYSSSRPLRIILSEEAKNRKFSEFMEFLQDDENDPLRWSAADGTTLYKFLWDNREGFFDNRVTRSIPSLKISEGAKLLRCFKYFAPGFNTTRWLQDLASRYVQDNALEGQLYLSVHPLDFLTLSENSNNWRSCHALDGEFRAGNLSYMLDDTTVIAYFASPQGVQLKCMPDGMVWNSKKWRMLLHTDQFKSIVYFNRQYPFDSNELVKHTYYALMDFAAPTLQYPQRRGFKYIHIGDSETQGISELDRNHICGAGSRLYDTEDIIDASDYRGYCDLIHSPHYTPVASVTTEGWRKYVDVVAETEVHSAWDQAFKNLFGLKIGAKVPCVKCGCHHVHYNDTFLCPECVAIEDADDGFYLACSECGSRIYSLNEAHLVQGEYVCDTCFSAINKEQEGIINHG